jgi:hypothetical protein
MSSQSLVVTTWSILASVGWTAKRPVDYDLLPGLDTPKCLNDNFMIWTVENSSNCL